MEDRRPFGEEVWCDHNDYLQIQELLSRKQREYFNIDKIFMTGIEPPVNNKRIKRQYNERRNNKFKSKD
jgi:hypothetical protein